MDLSIDSITVNMVVRTVTGKYWVEPHIPETTIQNIKAMIEAGDFIAEYIPSTFTTQSTGTLLITEKHNVQTKV